MSDQGRQDAVVFFARDFLATEFAHLSNSFPDLAHVYIVASAEEERTILSFDVGAAVYRLTDPGMVGPIDPDDVKINRDRFMRNMSTQEIEAIMGAVAGIAGAIEARYRVVYYFDEPVSGYPNAEFNRRFRAAGATALHFQTSWIPNFGFFVSDAAQAEPVPLNVVSGGAAMTRAHIQARAAGSGRPAYVIGYGKVSKRISDIVTTMGKIAYRRTARRNALYIDRDTSAHRTHVRSLMRSFGGAGYAEDPAAVPGRYLLFPLHYEPEAVLAYFSPYQRQEQLAAELLDSLPAGWTLVLKEHPSQPGALRLPKWADLRSAARVMCLPGAYPASRLLEQRPVVVSIGSTLALEAALAGCPVGVLGEVHFADAPGVRRIARPGDWPQLLDAAPATADQIADWYGWFVDTYCFKGMIMRGQTTIADLPAIAASLAKVRESGGEQRNPS